MGQIRIPGSGYRLHVPVEEVIRGKAINRMRAAGVIDGLRGLRGLVGLGVDYYVTPSQEQQDYLAAHGISWEVVKPATGLVTNAQGEVTSAVLYNRLQSDPYIQGGGNPLYIDPSSIPPPPNPAMEACVPRDTECTQRNLDKENQFGVLANLYHLALNGSTNPTAPDTYIKALATVYAGGTVNSTGATVNAPPSTPAVVSTSASSASSKPYAGQTITVTSIDAATKAQYEALGATVVIVPTANTQDAASAVTGKPNQSVPTGGLVVPGQQTTDMGMNSPTSWSDIFSSTMSIGGYDIPMSAILVAAGLGLYLMSSRKKGAL